MMYEGLISLGFEIDKDFTLTDHGDGQGSRFLWLAQDKPKPDNATIDAASAQVEAEESAELARLDSYKADTLRAEIIAHLKSDTPAELTTYVRGKINSDAVTNLATAIQFAKRMETFAVFVSLAIALQVRD